MEFTRNGEETAPRRSRNQVGIFPVVQPADPDAAPVRYIAPRLRGIEIVAIVHTQDLLIRAIVDKTRSIEVADEILRANAFQHIYLQNPFLRFKLTFHRKGK